MVSPAPKAARWSFCSWSLPAWRYLLGNPRPSLYLTAQARHHDFVSPAPPDPLAPRESPRDHGKNIVTGLVRLLPRIGDESSKNPSAGPCMCDKLGEEAVSSLGTSRDNFRPALSTPQPPSISSRADAQVAQPESHDKSPSRRNAAPVILQSSHQPARFACR